MKMTRQDLKGLVKECLVEILSEGLVETSRQVNENRQQSHRLPQADMPPRTAERAVRSNIADKINFLPNNQERVVRQQAPVPRQQNHHQMISSLTSDPILAEMFADTARNGGHTKITESSALPHKVDYEAMIAAGGDAAAKAMLRSDPTDVFAESASKWATLAFAEKGPAGSRAR
jgi:hypothetical protein